MIYIAIIIGCLIGALIGMNAPVISYTYSSYLAIAIIAALESESQSDARDDEIRRLRVNSYSEVMTSQNAEVLKGVYKENTPQNLKELQPYPCSYSFWRT